MPVTVHPAQDVHLRAGVPLGGLRDALAAATGREELRRSPVFVGDRALDDHHVVGQPPLVAGALLRTTSGEADLAASALEASVHLAHVAGPSAGFLAPVPDGRSTSACGELRLRRGRHGSRARVRVRPRPGSRLELVDGTGRVRRVRRLRLRRSVSWQVGTRVDVIGPDGTCASRTELRPRPDLADVTFSALVRRLAASGDAGTEDGAARSSSTMVVAALVPAAASIALAVALRNPLFAVMALVGPLVVLAPILARRRRARHGQGRTDPVPGRRLTSAHCPRAGLRPVDLLTAALATAAVPRADLDRAGTGPERVLPGRAGGRHESSAHDERPVLPGDLDGGCLTVVGPRPAVLAHASRTVVALHASGRARHVVVLASPDRVPAWSWARWISGAHALTTQGHAPLPSRPGTLLVVDAEGTPALSTRLGAWHAAHGEHSSLLVLGDHASSVPSWCASVATVTTQEVTWTSAGRAPVRTSYDGVDEGWLEAYARRVCALGGRGRWSHASTAAGSGQAATRAPRGTALPASAALVDALDDVLAHDDGPGAGFVGSVGSVGSDEPTHRDRTVARSGDALVEAVVRRWTGGAADDLRAPIGIRSDGGPATIDLLADGPHALVAGTTGAGKSELLQTLVLTLALRSSPDDLAVALVDYKGGASFGACVDLPHVVGQVTDLDPGIAERALDGLRAELRRRERLFAAVGATDLATYRTRSGPSGETLPRLLIVVDELRAMADDHPHFIPGLVRIAAQGRSLGVHLVLATQRPSGAITPDMRANISVRVALRVVDEADSNDIIDSPAAADIPTGTPGRALVRRGLAEPETLQTYHAGGASSGPVRSAWVSPRWDASPGHRWSFLGAPGVLPQEDTVRTLVAAARAASRTLGLRPPRVPWTPELPEHVAWATLPAAPHSSVLLLGTADHPTTQRHDPFGWDLHAGHLLVVGRASTGRTTALRSVAHAARAAGCIVHVVGPAAAVPVDRSTLGTVVDRSDPRRVARLLTLLLSRAPLEPTPGRAPREHVLVVDGLEDVQRALAAVHRGAGAELLTSVLRDGLPRGVHVALSASGLPSTSTAALLSQRLLLSGRDTHDDAFLGIPAPLAGRGGPPGRGVLVGTGEPVRCQVAVVAHGAQGAQGAQGAEHGPGSDPGLSPWRIEPVPTVVRPSDLGPPSLSGGALPLGVGGDDASVTGLALGRGFLVCGPRGSGRSRTLALVAHAAQVDGAAVVAVLSRDSALLAAAAAAGCDLTLTSTSPRAASALVARLGDEAARRPMSGAGVVVVDDLDVLAQTCPEVVDAVQRLLESSPGTAVVAAAATAAAAGAFRGLLAELRGARRGIVLDPAHPGSSEVFGADLGWDVEPEVRTPGRGVLVDGGATRIVQLAHHPDDDV